MGRFAGQHRWEPRSQKTGKGLLPFNEPKWGNSPHGTQASDPAGRRARQLQKYQ